MKTIEHFLDHRVANEYFITNHHFFKVVRETFADEMTLYLEFSDEIPRCEALRDDLRACLGPNVEARPQMARRWTMFLKPRINVLEAWSGMLTAFVAVCGFGSATMALLGKMEMRPETSPGDIPLGVALIAVSVGFVGFKFYIDRKASWYKFIVTHLEAIAAQDVEALSVKNGQDGVPRAFMPSPKP